VCFDVTVLAWRKYATLLKNCWETERMPVTAKECKLSFSTYDDFMMMTSMTMMIVTVM
jgi:hypothetical protein